MSKLASVLYSVVLICGLAHRLTVYESPSEPILYALALIAGLVYAFVVRSKSTRIELDPTEAAEIAALLQLRDQMFPEDVGKPHPAMRRPRGGYTEFRIGD